MLINADFSRPAIVTPGDHDWVDSPQSGVQRVMLDRVGEEQARATSIVRYAPDSLFPRHQHPGGEDAGKKLRIHADRLQTGPKAASAHGAVGARREAEVRVFELGRQHP